MTCKYCGRPEALPIGSQKCDDKRCSPIPYYVQMVRPRLQKMRTWVPKSFDQKRIPALLARLHFNLHNYSAVDEIMSKPWPFGRFPGIWNT